MTPEDRISATREAEERKIQRIAREEIKLVPNLGLTITQKAAGVHS
jgi:hypothetical protein